MSWKKTAALICAAAMMMTAIAGCGEKKEETAADSSPAAEMGMAAEEGGIEEIVFATPLSKTVDMAPIEAELNKILEEKIGVRVKIEGISMANYTNQVGLMMSGDEQLDVLGFIGTYSNMLAKNQLMCLDDYIDDYGAETKEVLGEEFLKSTSKGGSLYALPNNNGKAAVLNIVLRSDLVRELDLPVDQLKQAADFDEFCENLDLLTDMFAKIKAAHPELVCMVPASTNPNHLMFTEQMPFTDLLNDSNGVLMPGEEKNITNLYASDEYRRLLDYAYQWNQAGYILEDATTTQETTLTYMQNGRTASYFIKGEEGQAEQITTATGVDVDSIKLVQPYINTSDVNGIGFAISATSKHPEAAMKFLNEMYTNPDVVNLLAWGIEGTHYEVQDDGTIDFPEGLDAATTTYGLNMDWFFGNQFLTYIWGKGRDTTIYSRLEANNKNAQFSPVMGFSYDSTPVSTEIAALTNVKNQYLPGLACGSLNPKTELPKFLQALEDAGLQKVIDEKQAQLDAWIAENK